MKIFKRKSTTRNIISMPKASNSSIQRRKRFSLEIYLGKIIKEIIEEKVIYLNMHIYQYSLVYS
jgi:hypothetical protein